jgi:hypothetical protein
MAPEICCYCGSSDHTLSHCPWKGKSMKPLLLLPLLALLSGCLASFNGVMENRITTTLACDRAFFASLYGPIGVTSEVDKKDLAMLPCAAREKRAAEASAIK